MSTLHLIKTGDDDTFIKLEMYRDIDRKIKLLEKEKKIIGDELKAGFFLNNTDYVREGRLLATYRPEIQVRFDQESFKTAQPVLFEQYQKKIEIRKFLLK